jgi:hypothetical protein
MTINLFHIFKINYHIIIMENTHTYDAIVSILSSETCSYDNFANMRVIISKYIKDEQTVPSDIFNLFVTKLFYREHYFNDGHKYKTNFIVINKMLKSKPKIMLSHWTIMHLIRNNYLNVIKYMHDT